MLTKVCLKCKNLVTLAFKISIFKDGVEKHFKWICLKCMKASFLNDLLDLMSVKYI